MNLKPETGIYRDKSKIEELFKNIIIYHSQMFDQLIGEFSADSLFENWRSLIRSVDEIINIPMELDDREPYLKLRFEMMSSKGRQDFEKVVALVHSNFGAEVAKRFKLLAIMSLSIDHAYHTKNMWPMIGYGLGLSSVSQSINYFQSRRLAFGAILNLIPLKATGKKNVPQIDLMNQFLYTIDTCLVGFAGIYYHLLINECIEDYEVTFDGTMFKTNFTYENLEGFFFEPERLSLIDQMELRPDIVEPAKTITTPQGVVFSFNEIANAMALFEGAFKKYNVSLLAEYDELNILFMHIARFCTDNYNVILDESELDQIQNKLKKLKLTSTGQTYVDVVNDYAPFQKFDGRCYSTVVLLSRFVYRTLTGALKCNRSFMINSGFIFEDKVQRLLEEAGYHCTGITRINKKEFDLITTKNGKIYNFQCKNNLIDISKVGTDYKLMGRHNRRLVKYYRKSITKEINREQLVTAKVGLTDIEHFIISRFPVITRDKDILNFNTLENWIYKQKH
ncbi:hypothetical protein [Pedobacter gandavensis]|uniref:hypothetical protein n=1 Tax=Pedobacter gandavensis TaxID=2679963 RepID=UPI00292F2A0A|nr:hypothetical protein [Pedobacter gandavensis]